MSAESFLKHQSGAHMRSGFSKSRRRRAGGLKDFSASFVFSPACCGELWSAADAQGEPVGKAPQGADGGAPRFASTACFGGSPRRHGYPGFVQLLRLEEGPKVLKLKG